MITLTELVVWILIAALVGFIGEFLAHRHAPDGIIGAIILGLIAIFLVVGLLHLSIPGDLQLAGVPLITTIIVAAILVFIWSRFVYHRYYHPYASRYYYRRGTYARRPRRRWF